MAITSLATLGASSIVEVTWPTPAVAVPNDAAQSLAVWSGSGGQFPERTAVGDTLFFSSVDGRGDSPGLWKSDGTRQGTVRIEPFGPDVFTGLPQYLTNVNGILFFSAWTNGRYQLWKSDGTAVGTTLVRSYASGGPDSPIYLTNVNGVLFFRTYNAKELWRSDGTAIGTFIVKTFPAGGGLGTNLTAAGNTLYFTGSDGANGSELWKSNGNAVGTVQVKNIGPGSGSSSPSDLTSVGSTLFFVADDGVSGRELWKSDGTAAGTVLVKDIGIGPGVQPKHLTDVNGTLFFQGNDTGAAVPHGAELWKSDGTSAGTGLVADTVPGAGSSHPSDLVALGSRLVFAAVDSSHGTEPWISDGTSAGTTMIMDVADGYSAGYPEYLTRVGGQVFFSADDGIHGEEVWRTDGSAAGTALVRDIRPSWGSSRPYGFTDASGTLFFVANDGETGTELFVGRDSGIDDVLAPATTIDSGPSDGSHVASSSTSITFSADEPSTFQCKLDNAAFSACTSPQALTALYEGQHTFSVRATDTSGNTDVTAATRTWIVDTTPPDTTITSGPDEGTTLTTSSATFQFSSTEPITFQCKLDNGTYLGCDNPTFLSGLGEGLHTFTVRAVDTAGNFDPTPDTRTWNVDTVGPDTTITVGPAPAATLTTGDASFSFTSTDNTASFECKLDSGAYSACTSPRDLTALADGSHTFTVRAKDPAGNTDPTPATRTWTIDTTAPDTTITAGPTQGSTLGTGGASLSFSSSDGTAAFECKIDTGSYATCTSPKVYAGLSDGAHTFTVRAKDPAGNTDPTPATRTWTIDTTAPDTTITAGPAEAATLTTGDTSLSFTSPDDEATFECRLDTGPFSTCTSPHDLAGLGEGSHTFSVRATDTAGNTDPTPATRTWTVDTTPPPPSNAFSPDTTGTPDLRTGTLRVGVTVPAAGVLEVAGSSVLRAKRVEASNAGRVAVTLVLTRQGKQLLKRKRAAALASGKSVGKLRVLVTWTYVPAGGTSSTRGLRYTFKLR